MIGHLGHLGGIRIIISALVPLQRTAPDGTVTDALAWRIGEEIHVHPERIEAFKALVKALTPARPTPATAPTPDDTPGT